MTNVHQLLADACARQILMIPDDARRAALLAALSPEERKLVKQSLRRLQQVSCDHTPLTLTRLDLWHAAWKDIKLRAFDWRFYQHQTWTPASGDFYTLCRCGPELFRVVKAEQEIEFQAVVNEDGVEIKSDVQVADVDTFIAKGFAASRLHVPNWIWKTEAQARNITLTE